MEDGKLVWVSKANIPSEGPYTITAVIEAETESEARKIIEDEHSGTIFDIHGPVFRANKDLNLKS